MSSKPTQVLEQPDSRIVPLREVAVLLHADDDVAIAKVQIHEGMTFQRPPGVGLPGRVTVRDRIPAGHKIALRDLDPGACVRRYGQVIGRTSRPIRAGEHVHTHNLGLADVARDHTHAPGIRAVEYVPEAERLSFQGYRREDGRVGTRNYIAVIGTVNCSAHACLQIAHHFTPERLAAYPQMDGVIALTHHAGCPVEQKALRRTLAGMACHPNVGASILVGLGCETNQVDKVLKAVGDLSLSGPSSLVIQERGGLRHTIEAGITAVERLLPEVNAARRTPEPISGLMLALQCGGSDSWSGITANPLVGRVSDRLVREGGAVVLAETSEMYGAEHLLAQRASSPEVARKLAAMVREWEEYATRQGITLDDNRSAGNAAGGLTTILEKSLGAVAKAGITPVAAAYDYAEPVSARGVSLMNSPGFDPVAVTGQVAGGCNLVVFTTGRGSVFGFKPAPVIKVSSNSELYQRMRDDIDFDAGRILEGADMDEMAEKLLDLVVDVASGQPSKSEVQGIGEAEFVPWIPEGTL